MTEHVLRITKFKFLQMNVELKTAFVNNLYKCLNLAKTNNTHTHTHTHTHRIDRKVGNVLFNNVLNTFYLRLYGMVKLINK